MYVHFEVLEVVVKHEPLAKYEKRDRTAGFIAY